jgi:hypothetical protein
LFKTGSQCFRHPLGHIGIGEIGWFYHSESSILNSLKGSTLEDSFIRSIGLIGSIGSIAPPIQLIKPTQPMKQIKQKFEPMKL